MGVAFAFIGGCVVTTFFGWLVMQQEWRARRELERKVKEIWEHLACGGGYLGCSGGPHCNYDHK